MTKIKYREFFAFIDLPLQIVDCDAGNAEIPQEFLASNKFVKDVSHQGANQQNKESTSQTFCLLGDFFNLVAEHIPEPQKCPGPEQRAQCIEKQKLPEPHVKDSSQGRGDGVEARKKFREEQRTSTLSFKQSFGASDAGIWFERNLAEKLKDLDSLCATELVPDGVGGKGR